MIIKEQLKIPNADETDYSVVYTENSADMVKFSDTTLAAALENFEVGKIAHADYSNFAETAEKDSAGNKITEYYLPIDNAAMSGTPTAPNYESTDTSVNKILTCADFNAMVRKVAGNVDSDMTLAKLITSINQDPNFATKTAIQLGEKQNKTPPLNSIAEGNFAKNSILYSTNSDTFVATPITAFGRKLLAAQNLDELNHLLRAEVPRFYDESERTMWNVIGYPTLATAQAKFGNALRVDANNYLRTAETVVFGGNPFTIQCWLYYPQTSSTQMLIDFGAFRLRAISDSYLELADSSGNKICVISKNSSATWHNQTFHLEIGYTGGLLRPFENGTDGRSFSFNIPRAARTIQIGGGLGFWIDELRILDGICAHTATFTPPTAKYSVTSQTVSLLHFD